MSIMGDLFPDVTQEERDYADAAERAGMVPPGSAQRFQAELERLRRERREAYVARPVRQRLFRSALAPIVLVVVAAFIAAALLGSPP